MSVLTSDPAGYQAGVDTYGMGADPLAGLAPLPSSPFDLGLLSLPDVSPAANLTTMQSPTALDPNLVLTDPGNPATPAPTGGGISPMVEPMPQQNLTDPLLPVDPATGLPSDHVGFGPTATPAPFQFTDPTLTGNAVESGGGGNLIPPLPLPSMAPPSPSGSTGTAVVPPATINPAAAAGPVGPFQFENPTTTGTASPAPLVAPSASPEIPATFGQPPFIPTDVASPSSVSQEPSPGPGLTVPPALVTPATAPAPATAPQTPVVSPTGDTALDQLLGQIVTGGNAAPTSASETPTEVGTDPLSKLLTGGWNSLITTGGAPLSQFGQAFQNQLQHYLTNPENSQILQGARANYDAAHNAMLREAMADLAERGIGSMPGMPSGMDVQTEALINRELAPSFNASISDALKNLTNTALGAGAQQTANNQSALQQALSGGAGYQQMLGDLALRNLQQNTQFQEFAAQLGLDAQKAAAEIALGQNTQLLNQFAQYLALVNTVTGGGVAQSGAF